MAILINEEGEKKANILRIGLWVLVFVLIAVGAYYIFFKQAALVEVVSPSAYKNIDPLAKIELNPQQVFSSAAFKSLQSYVPPPAPAVVGREDPFIAP